MAEPDTPPNRRQETTVTTASPRAGIRTACLQNRRFVFRPPLGHQLAPEYEERHGDQDEWLTPAIKLRKIDSSGWDKPVTQIIPTVVAMSAT